MSSPSLAANPLLRDWLRCDPERNKVFVRSGKIELGQHIGLTICQIAADGIGLALSQVAIEPPATGLSADERFTAGSFSVEHSGGAVHAATQTARRLMAIEVGLRFNVAPEAVDFVGGRVFVEGEVRESAVIDLLAAIDLDARVDVGPTPIRRGMYVGEPLPDPSVQDIVSGRARFIQDLSPPGLLHGRVLRPHDQRARLAGFDSVAMLGVAGVLKVVSRGRFVAVIGEDEQRLDRALPKLHGMLRWESPEVDDAADASARLVGGRCNDFTFPAGHSESPANTEAAVWLSFSRPMLAHASIGPACGIAIYREPFLEVWCASQGIYPLRAAMAKALGMEVDHVLVHHVPNAGCYGHNAADDSAFDAALVALECQGRPVRVLWTRADELAMAPAGPPMRIEAAGAIDAFSNITHWSYEIWSGSHGTRPGMAGNINLLAAEEAGLAPRPNEIRDVPAAAGGGAERNAFVPYRAPRHDVIVHIAQDLPVRSSALRSLGAFLNVFAIESLVDQLAHQAGIDPVELRLRNLDDPRACGVISRVDVMRSRSTGAPGSGIGFARYKDKGAYAAVAVEIELDLEIRVTRVWAAIDAGLIVNPDAALNQIEGGIIQAISWTLKEELRSRGGEVLSRSWADYPILGFAEVPEINVEFVDPAGPLPPLGVGECVHGPTAAAIGNALFASTGLRVGDLPLNRARLMSAMNG